MTAQAVSRLVIIVTLLLLPSVTFPRISPEIIPVNDLPGPVITEDEHGRNHIDIRAANSHGISHNQYQEFHVSEHGVVFNNQAVQADIIFNEVVGTRLSQLNGIMEVAGKTADVIVSNPNGINCNGCAFMNSTYGLLTTGKFVFERDVLTGINVNSGHITVGEQGVAMYGPPVIARGKIDLIAAGVTINGKIRGETQNQITDKKVHQMSDGQALQRIRIIAGSNKVSRKQEDNSIYITEYSDNELGQHEKIDVGMLGGMHAGQIYLYGSKAGIGVNSHAVIQGVENLVIDSMGALTLNAPVTANQYIEIKNAPVVTNHSRLIAAESIRINGVQHFINGSQSEKLSDELSGAAIRAKHIDISAATLSNYGSVLSEHRMQLNTGKELSHIAQQAAIKTSDTQETRSENLDAGMNENALINHGNILSNGDIFIRAPLFNNFLDDKKANNERIPLIYAAGSLSINTLQGSNRGGILSAHENLAIRSMDGRSSSGVFNNQAVTSDENQYTKFSGMQDDILVDRKTIKSSGGFIFSGNDLTIDLKSFSNHGAIYQNNFDENVVDEAGKVYANNKINITVDSFKNIGGEINGEIVNISSAEEIFKSVRYYLWF